MVMELNEIEYKVLEEIERLVGTKYKNKVMELDKRNRFINTIEVVMNNYGYYSEKITEKHISKIAKRIIQDLIDNYEHYFDENENLVTDRYICPKCDQIDLQDRS